MKSLRQSGFEIHPIAKNTFLLKGRLTKRYLFIPIEDNKELAQVSLVVDNALRSENKMRLACIKVQYHVELDLVEFLNQQITLTLSELGNLDLLWDEFKFSDMPLALGYNAYRPLFHFAPLRGWINDPNGMFYKHGIYHLCFQYNPYGATWQNISWGHAISKDLIKWEQIGNALNPDGFGQIFSGSAVVDKHNDAGFGLNTVLAFYTNAHRLGGQTQSLAYSTDKGYCFTKYKDNPILLSSTADFRDPKVFYHKKSKSWIMVLAANEQMEFYSSLDLINWEYKSSFGQGIGNHLGVWECPDLIELYVDGTDQTYWVLLCNINPGGPFGGSATQYFVGDFNGSVFTALPGSTVKWMDYGKDFYAGVTWSNAPSNKCIATAWMNNWQYADLLPTGEFKGINTLARELDLFKYQDQIYLRSSVVKQLRDYCFKHHSYFDLKIEQSDLHLNLLGDNIKGYVLDIELDTLGCNYFKFSLYNTLSEQVVFSVDLQNNTFCMDRSLSGLTDFDPSGSFNQITTAPIFSEPGKLTLEIIVDSCSMEIFINQGTSSMTNLVFASKAYNKIHWIVEKGSLCIDSLVVYKVVV